MHVRGAEVLRTALRLSRRTKRERERYFPRHRTISLLAQINVAAKCDQDILSWGSIGRDYVLIGGSDVLRVHFSVGL